MPFLSPQMIRPSEKLIREGIEGERGLTEKKSGKSRSVESLGSALGFFGKSQAHSPIEIGKLDCSVVHVADDHFVLEAVIIWLEIGVLSYRHAFNAHRHFVLSKGFFEFGHYTPVYYPRIFDHSYKGSALERNHKK